PRDKRRTQITGGSGASAGYTPRAKAELSRGLEEADRSSLLVDVDVHGGGSGAETGHRLHVAAERHDPAGPGVSTQVAHRDREAGRRVRQCCVVRQREVSFGHADRQIMKPHFGELLNLPLCRRQEEDPVRAVDALRDRLDLGLDRGVERIDVVERIRLVRRGHDGFGQRSSAGAPLLEGVVHFGRKGPVLEGESPQAVDLLVGVAGESVDRHDSLQSELSHDPEVAGEIGGTYFERLDSTFSRTVIAPAARSCSAVTLSPLKVWATVIAPSRRRRSFRSDATATIAITSEPAVMSKPVWRT